MFNYENNDGSVIYVSFRKQEPHLISGYTTSQLVSGVDDKGKYFQKKKKCKRCGKQELVTHLCVKTLFGHSLLIEISGNLACINTEKIVTKTLEVEGLLKKTYV